MKKYIFIVLATFTLTATTFGAIYKSAYENIAPAIYKCPNANTDKICTIHKLKNGTLDIEKSCNEASTKYGESLYAPMIKGGKCKSFPDTSKYYTCEYADTTCNVTISSNSKVTVGCGNKNKIKLTDEQRTRIYKRVEQDALQGNCRDTFEETPQATD